MTKDTQPNLELKVHAGSKIWRRLHKVGSTDNVEVVADHAAAILKDISRHMPFYTLHDERHILNILGWMDWLLADSVHQLSAIDYILLLMAAYCHDLGMALPQAEYEQLIDDSVTMPTPERIEFEAFLDGHAEEKWQIQKLRDDRKLFAAGLIQDHLLTQYLRTTHAPARGGRLKKHLDRIKAAKNESLFLLGGLSFREELEVLCISHNQDPRWLADQCEERKLHSNYHGHALHLPLLGAILRLADILDFDASRTPAILFHHRGLDGNLRPFEETLTELSRQEWRKHLAISAIEYQANENCLSYKAEECPDPATEHSIRTFVDWIRKEIDAAQCHHALHLPRVQHHIVAAKDSIGKPLYEYEDWSFHLNHDEITALLMGLPMYGQRGFAIRELIQNSLDALELRDLRLQYKCKTHTDSSRAATDGPCAKPGFFTDLNGLERPLEAELTWGWDESEKRWWIQVSDNGVGMTKEAIGRYFTNLGKSFYRSEEYQREEAALRRVGLISTPISQFGIGILSCFMLADQIEVRTHAGKGQATDVKIAGSSGLFWKRPGTRTEQGTEIKLWLQRGLNLHHDREKCIEALRGEFHYAAPGASVDEFDPFFELARTTVWPKYPIRAYEIEGSDPPLILDQNFHLEVLNPINCQLVNEKAAEWDIALPAGLKLGWKPFEWIDGDGPLATGSRVRIWIPTCAAPNEAWQSCLLRGLVESQQERSSRATVLVRSMKVEEVSIAESRTKLSAGVGLPVWIDLRGAASPALTADRRRAMEPAAASGWDYSVDAVFERLFDGLVRAPRLEWLDLQTPVKVRTVLASVLGGIAGPEPIPTVPGLTPQMRFSLLLQECALSLWQRGDLARDDDRDREYRQPIKSAIARTLDRKEAQGRAHALIRARANDLIMVAPALLYSHFLQEAYYPRLRESWPALGLYVSNGHIADAQLTAPTRLRLDRAGDGGVRPASGPNPEPELLNKREFDLCLPSTAIPLWTLRQRFPEWGRTREWRRAGALPFLAPFAPEALGAMAAGLRLLGHLYAFRPAEHLWEKPFPEWTAHDWQHHANLSLLWLMGENKVVGLRGCKHVDEVRSNGVPFADLEAPAQRSAA